MSALAADLLRYLQTKWIYWGDRNQQIWEQLLDIIGDDPIVVWVFGTLLIVFITYWVYAAFFTFIDLTNKPSWILKYKIQPDQNFPVEREKLWKAIKQVLFNQLVVTTVFLYTGYLIMFRSLTPEALRQLPTMKTYFIQLVLMSVLEEPLFYYAHRMLHHRSIYKYFHKKHHEWTAPIAAMTFYCHPFEHVVSNLGPIAILTCLLNTHIVVAWTFSILAIINSMTDHTGYYFSFPFAKESVLFHDYHHAKFNYNFGVFGWLDKLHGTYKKMKDDIPVKSKNTQNKLRSKDQ